MQNPQVEQLAVLSQINYFYAEEDILAEYCTYVNIK